MKKIFLFVLLFSAFSNLIFSQTNIKFGGFIKTDVIYDTRQTVNAREGHFLLYPAMEKLDANNVDVNATPNFNILSIQTRVNAKIDGVELLSGKVTGFIEAEFFGSNDAVTNGVRMRHAYIDYNFDDTQILVGQTWHPFFQTESFPDVISFNTGVPFQPFARSPQIKFTQKFDALKVSLGINTQRDFANFGPGDVVSSNYMRNAGIPEVTLGLQLKTDNFLLGATGSYKTIRPYLENPISKLKSEDNLSSFGVTAYTKLTFDKFQFKLQGTYGGNMNDLMFIGGFATKSIDSNLIEYTPEKILAGWVELMYKSEFEYGVFVGYSQNLGTDDNPSTNVVWGRGTNINQLMRVSPRIAYNYGKTKTAFEVEYTTACFGKIDKDDKALVKDAITVSNVRLLLAFYLFL